MKGIIVCDECNTKIIFDKKDILNRRRNLSSLHDYSTWKTKEIKCLICFKYNLIHTVERIKEKN